MSRFPRLRRRPDAWHDAHERARARAAERLDGPLGLTETQWLDEHLAGCPDCSAVAAAYVADRQTLRALRDDQPEPPRDLWARTATAIEQLSLRSEGASTPATEPAERPAASPAGWLRRLPLNAMSAFVVVVVVVGALLTNGIYGPSGGGQGSAGASPGIALGSSSVAPGPPGAEATPYAVKTGHVSWVEAGPGGVSYSSVEVEQVCPEEGSANCSDVPEEGSTKLALDAAPRTLIGSPSSSKAVAISKTATAGDQVVVVTLPDSDATAAPSPTPTRTAAPTASPSEAATAPPEGSEPPASATPTVVIQSAAPSATPLETPESTKGNELAIASGIEVVGESAAFSADGSWFAFTARPKDGSGPDVYVWRVGDASASRLTTDGTSYFGSWAGDRAVVSRPADATARVSDPVSVLIDPTTGAEQAVGALWRPMLDPSGRFAIGWDGSLTRTDDPLGWAPANGHLALRTWTAIGDGEPQGSDDQRNVTDQARGDFDARWDETGEWVAIWVGNDGDASVGRLTLYHLDTKKDRLEHIKGAPEEVQALPGFSNGAGRLAWATPRGSGGEGSRVQIAAWSIGGVGVVASSPGEDVVVIR